MLRAVWNTATRTPGRIVRLRFIRRAVAAPAATITVSPRGDCGKQEACARIARARRRAR